MKRSSIGLLVLLIALALSGCIPAFPVAQTGSEGTPAPIVTEELPPAVQAALNELASRITLPVGEEIHLINYEAVDWPNGCLGVTRPGVMCTMMVTPGYRVIMEAGGAQYESHTNQDGSVIVNADPNAPENQGGASQAAINVLAAELGIDPSQVSLVSDSTIDFNDGCLGVAIPGQQCLQAVTPGHIFVLEAGGVQYEVHTDAEGIAIQMATLALSWHREGGIAGFNDDLVVFLPGRVYASDKSKQAADGLQVVLSEAELAQWNAWLAQYGDVQITQSDNASADSMTTTLHFSGHGSEQPDEAAKQAMLVFAQDLFNKLMK